MIIGLTGPMASGKNLACSLLEKAGCVSVDADVLAHEAIEKAKNEILRTFEQEAKSNQISLLKEDGSINRRELAKIVFASRIILEYVINDSLPISKIEASGILSTGTSALSP